MDLIREILLFAEENNVGKFFNQKDLPDSFHEVKKEDWFLHCKLITDRGLAKGQIYPEKGFAITAITWDGYDFLDNSRSPEVWNAAKVAAGHLSFTVFGNVLTKLATDYGLGLLKSGYDAALAKLGGS